MMGKVPVIEFFDSYGYFTDTEKKHINSEFLLSSGQKFFILQDCCMMHLDIGSNTTTTSYRIDILRHVDVM